MSRTNSHVSWGERLEHMNCTQDPSNFYDSFDLVLVPVIQIYFWRSGKEQWKHNRIVNFECENGSMIFRMATPPYGFIIVVDDLILTSFLILYLTPSMFVCMLIA